MPAAASQRRASVLAPQRPIFHHVSRTILRPLFKAYFHMRAEGLDRLPPGPCLVAPNHVSMLDWAFLLYWFPRLIRFVVHSDYYEHPIMGFGVRVNGAVVVRTDRPDLAAMRAARAVLAAGEPLILFPRGHPAHGAAGRRHPHHQHGDGGAVPIVPVAIRGAFEAFPRSARLPQPGCVSVVFGTPLPPPPAADRTIRQRFANHLMAHIAALLDGAPQPSPPWGVEA
jgi:1-acyl-sn-glycerol-3-phosphate acyltransferase